MSNWSDRTTYHGKRVNKGTWYLLQAANKMLATRRFGGEREPMTLLQGSYSRAVGASAGTHNGGGAYDRTPYNNANRNHVLRLLGVADWDRPARRGVWVRHGHGIVDGDGTAAAIAKRQVTAYHNRRDGLAGNGPDRGYRMVVFPLFVFPEKAVGKPGKRYCVTACHVYEQQTARSKNLGPVTVGEVLEAVAVTNVNGEYWFVTADGKCGFEGNFSKTKPTTTSQPVSAPQTATQPAPTPTGEVTPPPFELWVALLNIAADYMPGYSRRVSGIAKVITSSRASVVATCESGSYADGTELNKRLGWGGVRGESFVLHGGAVPVTTAIHLDPDKRTVIAEGQFETYGPINRWATWVLLKDMRAGVYLLVACTHLEYRPKGPNNIRAYDVTRQRQLEAVFQKTQRIAANEARTRGVARIPIVVLGDMNGDADDPYDGPGKAAVTYGFKDTDRVAAKRVNGTASTHARPGGLSRGGRIDRVFVSPGIGVKEQATLDAYPHTDHNLVSVLLTVSNTK